MNVKRGVCVAVYVLVIGEGCSSSVQAAEEEANRAMSGDGLAMGVLRGAFGLGGMAGRGGALTYVRREPGSGRMAFGKV